jgi:hypothetical protein
MAVGLSSGKSKNKNDLVIHSLDIYGRAGAWSALDPVAFALVADEKRQDKQ